MNLHATPVECYSGAIYAERPVAVHWQSRRLVVERVLRSWRTPAGPGFEAATAGQRSFRLQLDEAADVWSVEEITAGAGTPVGLALK